MTWQSSSDQRTGSLVTSRPDESQRVVMLTSPDRSRSNDRRYDKAAVSSLRRVRRSLVSLAPLAELRCVLSAIAFRRTLVVATASQRFPLVLAACPADWRFRSSSLLASRTSTRCATLLVESGSFYSHSLAASAVLSGVTPLGI